MGIGLSIVIPTVGRPSLERLLSHLPSRGLPPGTAEIIVVDDRRIKDSPLRTPEGVRVVPGPAKGPAAARNAGWRATDADWIAFLDDDVIPGPGWWTDLRADLDQPPHVAGVQARILVPQAEPGDRSDWAANSSGLNGAPWITADMAYRREALIEVDGFDERFPRAYREDTDLAYRIQRSGRELVLGRRRTLHPVRAEGRWISLRTQLGNADDALLRRLYGPCWHHRLGVPRGRRHIHALTSVSAFIALVTVGRFKSVGLTAAAVWALATAEFVLSRRRHAPAEPLAPLIITSVLIPPLAVGHWLKGWWKHRRILGL